MSHIDLNSVGNYQLILRHEAYGTDPVEREAAAHTALIERLREIEKRRNRQEKWIMASYLVCGLVSYSSFSIGSVGLGLLAAFFVNMAAFYYGKYTYCFSGEELALRRAVEKWESEGRPSYADLRKEAEEQDQE